MQKKLMIGTVKKQYILENQETSADELLRKFNGVWEKDISKIFTINN